MARRTKRFGTIENDRFLEGAKERQNEVYVEKVAELQTFYNNMKGLNIITQPTWENLVKDAEACECDPVLFYIRIKALTENRLQLVSKKYKQNMLTMAKERLLEIKLPQAAMSAYNRITRGPRHISSAKRIISRIVANNQVISETVLTD